MIVLHKCAINDSHMMYHFLRFEARQIEFFIIWSHVLLSFYHFIILHKCTKSHDHELHCSWDMARDGLIVFYFGQIFALLTPLIAQKYFFK